MTSHPTVRRRLNFRGGGDDEDDDEDVEDIRVFTGMILMAGGLFEVWLYWKCLTQNLSKTGPFREKHQSKHHDHSANFLFRSPPSSPSSHLLQFRFFILSIVITFSSAHSVRCRGSECSATTHTLVSLQGCNLFVRLSLSLARNVPVFCATRTR